MKRIAISGLIALFIVGFTSIEPFAQDWPQWRGEHRDGKASSFEAPKTWPEQLKVVWQKDIGLGDASPSCPWHPPISNLNFHKQKISILVTNCDNQRLNHKKNHTIFSLQSRCYGLKFGSY